jgi:outer membrane lipoprotein-sorting protein
MLNYRIKLLSFPLCSLLLVFAAAACASRPAGDSGAGSNAAPASSDNRAGGGGGGSRAAAISENDKPLDAMTRAMRAQLDAKSYRAHVTSTMPDGSNNAMVIEYVAPDRYRMTSDVQVGGKGMRQEFVIVGGATYIKAPNGSWVRSPVDASGIVKAFRDPKMLDELTKTADVKFVGADTIDGVPMLVYQYTQNNPMGMNLKSTAKTWLSVADGLPRKTEMDSEYQGKKNRTLVTISDYNADIKIESPIK